MNAKTKSAERYEAFQSGKCDRLMMAVGTVEAIGWLVAAFMAATIAASAMSGCYALTGQPSDKGNGCPPGAVNCFYSTGWDVGPEKDFGPHKDGTYFTKDGVLVKEDGAVWHNQDAVEQFCNLASDGKQICSSSSVCPASSTCAKEGLECFIGICEMPELCKQNAPDAPPVCWSFCRYVGMWECEDGWGQQTVTLSQDDDPVLCKVSFYPSAKGATGKPGDEKIAVPPENPYFFAETQPNGTMHIWHTDSSSKTVCTKL